MLLAGPISHTSTQYIDFCRFFTFHLICLPFFLLILVCVELPLCVVVTILECCGMFKLSIRSFVLFLIKVSNWDLKRALDRLNKLIVHFYIKVPAMSNLRWTHFSLILGTSVHEKFLRSDLPS